MSIKNTADLTLKTDVRHVWEIGIRTIEWDYWSDSNFLGKFFMEALIFGQWWERYQFLANKVYVFSDSAFYFGKTNEIPEPMEFEWNLPRIHHIAALQQSPTVPVEYEHRNRKFHWTEYLHVDVQRHLMGIFRQCSGMRIKRSARFYAKKFKQEKWSFLGRGSEKNNIPITNTNHEENGTESLNCWWSSSEKADTQFSESHGETVETVFPTIISVFQGSVDEQSQICVKNVKFAMSKQDDMWWQENRETGSHHIVRSAP